MVAEYRGRVNIEKDTLVELYVEQRLSIKEIAGKLELGATTISRHLKKHGIETDSKNRIAKPKIYKATKEELVALYLNQKLTGDEIAEKLNIGLTTVFRLLKQYEIELVDRYDSILGAQHGQLTVIEEIRQVGGKRGDSPVKCVCKCTCGKTVIVTKGNLPNTKSCGCYMIPHYMIGQRYGKLLAIEFVNKTLKLQKNVSYIKCLCDCGKETIVSPGALRDGGTVSCGCKRDGVEFRIKAGTRFGKLIANNRIRVDNEWRYACICDCGKTNNVKGSILKSGKTKSCGCLISEVARLPNGESVRNLIFHGYRQNASKRNLIFDIQIQDAEKFFKQNCYYCNVKPRKITRKNAYGEYYANGIDRIDNSKGYIEGNMASCCTNCNLSKSTMAKNKFLNWVNRLSVSNKTYNLLLEHIPTSQDNRIYNKYQYSANDRNFDFSLSEEQFISLLNYNCHYCNREKSKGVDRLDSSKGYIENNVVPCCRVCNRAKNKYSLKDFEKWFIRLQEYQKPKQDQLQ